MSHRQYSFQNTNIEKLNARLLSIALAKDEKDWQSVLHTHHFTEIFFVVNGEGNFLFHDSLLFYIRGTSWQSVSAYLLERLSSLQITF